MIFLPPLCRCGRPRQKFCMACAACLRRRSAATIYFGDALSLAECETIVLQLRREPPCRTRTRAEAVIDMCLSMPPNVGVSWDHLREDGRHARTTKARELITVALHDVCLMSFPEIAAVMWRRGHSTFHTAYHRTTPEQRREWIEQIQRRLAA